jgi:hypothetical protein
MTCYPLIKTEMFAKSAFGTQLTCGVDGPL